MTLAVFPSRGVLVSLPASLDGIRVLDFTWLRSGPWGTRWLAALGAEVLKVQWTFNPGQRGIAPGADGKPIVDPNNSASNVDGNAGKLSITINVRSEKGFPLVKRLIEASDVVVENFTATVMTRWGLGYEQMREINPGIVYVSMGGFGHTGPQRDYMLVGQSTQSLSGLTYLVGKPGMIPAGFGYSYMDDTAGIYACNSVLTALHHRNKTGQGQHVDMAQMMIGATQTGAAFLDRTINERPARRPGFPPGNRAIWPGTALAPNYRGPVVAPHNGYQTKGDDHNDWCAIVCHTDEEWQALVKVMGSPGWAVNPKFATTMGRIENQEELDKGILEWTLTQEKYELMEKCQAAGVRAMPVQSADDKVDRDPQLEARGMFVERDHPVVGVKKLQNMPFVMSKSDVGVKKSSPQIGEHTVEVMERVLGLSRSEVVEGFNDGTFWPQEFPRFPHITESLEAPSNGAGSNGASTPKTIEPSVPNSTPGAGPFAGLRVLELADQQGHWCGKLLADLGADVIKIEAPGGDETRAQGPFLNDVPNRERSLYFWHYNTSKRGITLDVATDAGKQIFKGLAANADLVIETCPPGWMESQGLGYDELSKDNKRLIVCSITPFGQTGPWKDYKVSDLVLLASGGQMSECGYDAVDDPERPPIAVGGGQAWHCGSHYAYMAIVGALLTRDATGEGQYIDSSIHEALCLTTENAVPNYIFNQTKIFRHTGRHGSAREIDTEYVSGKEMPTKLEGHFATTAWSTPMLVPAKIELVAKWMDEYGMAQELADYNTPDLIAENRVRIYEILADFFKSMLPNDLWHGAAKIGLPWAYIRSWDEMINDDHLRARNFYIDVEHPELGQTFTYPGGGVIFNGSPWSISRRAPLIGEHNEEILCGELGFSKEQLMVLTETGVI